MDYIQITFETTDKQAEELSDALTEIGAVCVSFVDKEDDPIYEPELDKTELWKNTQVIALFETDTTADQVIKTLFSDYNFGDLQYFAEYLEDQSWERKWMDNYKPMKFGNKLWVCPSFDSVDESDSVVLYLDPGLAFGTGTHPTTRMCLQWLDQAAEQGVLKDKVVIDYGCGSGILGIAALKLGAKKVYGVDIDPQAIEASLANAQNNNIADQLELSLVKDFDHSIKADIVLANILAGPLVELADTLSGFEEQGAYITLSGILDIKESDIIKAYSPYYDLEPATHDEEWLMFNGKRKAN